MIVLIMHLVFLIRSFMANEGVSMQTCLFDELKSVHIDINSKALFCTLGCIGDYSHELFPQERLDLGMVSQQRSDEYSSGRRMAHEAMSIAIGTSSPVTTNDRKPIWPDGWVGSLSHSKKLATALLGQESSFAGVGIDLACRSSVSRKVAERITVGTEKLESSEDDLWTRIFSAKEALYKAVNPLTGEYLGMRDVELYFDDGGRRFQAKTVGLRRSSKIVDLGIGYIGTIENYWLSIFLVKPL